MVWLRRSSVLTTPHIRFNSNLTCWQCQVPTFHSFCLLSSVIWCGECFLLSQYIVRLCLSVPPCAEWWCETENWATTSFGYTVQAWHLSLFGHTAWMPDKSDAKQILTAAPLENWRRRLGRPRTTWMKTTQQDLESLNLSLNKAIDVAQNHSLWRMMSTFGATHS